MVQAKIDEQATRIALKKGEEWAFTYFYDQYSLLLYRRLFKMVQVDVIAEELLQDLFLKVWERREQIDPEQPFKAYLYRIAERMVYDHYRKRARDLFLERSLAQMSTELHHPVEEQLQAKEIQTQIRQAIDQLPDQQRRVFTLCKLEGKSYEEVSHLLKISTATINTHITRATKSIKKHLESQNGSLALLYGYAIAGWISYSMG